MKFWIFSLLMFLSPLAFAKAKASRYPQIQYIQGPAHAIEEVITVVKREPQKSERQKPLKKGQILKDKAVLKTDAKSEIRLALSSQDVLVIRENSLVILPEIFWKDGAIQDIQLRSGSLRYLCKDKCERKFITDLYAGVLPAGDFILRYNPESPEVELQVLKGEATFGGLENETQITLKPSEKAVFKGVLEDGIPAYDILLKGRKVAKGKLADTEIIPAEEILEFQRQEALHIQKVKAKPKSKRLASQICDKPWGELNQCVWVCENNPKKAKECKIQQGAQCVRMRCNANGEWSDRQVLSPSQGQCETKPLVGACDY